MYPVSGSSAYDRAITVFSPDGRLYQVEYASKAIEMGPLGLAIKYKDGVLFGADKRITSNLIVPESMEKIFKIDDHIGVVSAGLAGDARRMVQTAREKAQENRIYYDEPITIELLSKKLASIAQVFTQYGGARPFGVSFLIGGFDETGVRLFETEPSGALAEYHAVATGRGKREVMQLFEKEFKQGMTKEEAQELMIKGLKLGLEKGEKLDAKRLDFAFVDHKKVYTKLTNDEITALLKAKK